jgi:hypothetical protein
VVTGKLQNSNVKNRGRTKWFDLVGFGRIWSDFRRKTPGGSGEETGFEQEEAEEAATWRGEAGHEDGWDEELLQCWVLIKSGNLA